MELALSKGGRKYGFFPRIRSPYVSVARFSAKESSVPIPPTGDLTQYAGRVKDQSTLGACTAFARTGYAELIYKEFKGVTVEFSPLFFYYKERERDNSLPQDAGSTGETAFWTFHDVGCCLESTDPYDVRDFNRVPTQAQLDEAAKYKHGSEHTLQTADDARYAVASGYPVLIGITITESFEEGSWAKDTGIMPVPAGGILGGHELYAKAYDDNKKLLGIRNSWGADWGQNGDFWMPYDVFEQSLMEARIIHFGKPWVPTISS